MDLWEMRFRDSRKPYMWYLMHTHRFKAVMGLKLREMEGLVENKDGIKSQAQYSLGFNLICAVHTGPFNESLKAEETISKEEVKVTWEAVYAIAVFVLTPCKPPVRACRWIMFNSSLHVIKSEPVSPTLTSWEETCSTEADSSPPRARV